MPRVYHQKRSRSTRRTLRKHMPVTEQMLWYYLRDRRFHGYKFRRQYSIGRYVVDFYTAKPRLAVELDGDSHFTGDAPEYDKQRQEFIEACGIRFIRFTNDEIIKNVEGVLEHLYAVLTSP